MFTRWIPIGLLALLATGLVLSGSTLAQDHTPTIPVKTQVWLDLTATATTPTPGPDYTATYEAEFYNAVLTVTAMSDSVTPTVISPTPIIFPATATSTPGPAPNPLEAIKTQITTVNGGTFMMGTTLEEGTQAVDECALYGSECRIEWIMDSIPAHQVTVDTFQMEMFEVTTTQYVTFLNYLGPDSHVTGCEGTTCAATTDTMESSYIMFDGQTYAVTNSLYANHPVTGVTWFGAREYCMAIGRRLPTEAEWERAARGAQGFIYPWGNEFDAERTNSSQSDLGGTVPVNTYPASASVYGIFNLAGNVQEWVFDWYAADYYAQQADNPTANPTGLRFGDEKVLRGGSWDTGPLFLRSVHRRSEPIYTTSPAIGFRCVEGAAVEPPTPTPTATWTPTATAD